MAKFLDIHEEAVQSFIRPGGEAANLLDDVAKGVKTFSIAYLNAGKGGNRSGGNHIRSGRLLRGLFWNRTKLEGPLQGVARAGSSARHTLYFHDGTALRGASTIKRAGMMVPRKHGAAHTNLAFAGAGSQAAHASTRGAISKHEVRGQWRKPFLEEGLAASLAAQRL